MVNQGKSKTVTVNDKNKGMKRKDNLLNNKKQKQCEMKKILYG